MEEEAEEEEAEEEEEEEEEKRLFQDTRGCKHKKTKQIISMIVTKEKVSDGRMLKPLVKQVPCNVDKAIADGAYDTKDNFRFLDSIGAEEPVIKVRSNASSNAHGCMPRKMVVVDQLQDVKRWKRRHGYGMRWWMAESTFSCIKRIFGEHVKSVRWEKNMVNELLLKASIYNTFLGMGRLGQPPTKVSCTT